MTPSCLIHINWGVDKPYIYQLGSATLRFSVKKGDSEKKIPCVETLTSEVFINNITTFYLMPKQLMGLGINQTACITDREGNSIQVISKLGEIVILKL